MTFACQPGSLRLALRCSSAIALAARSFQCRPSSARPARISFKSSSSSGLSRCRIGSARKRCARSGPLIMASLLQVAFDAGALSGGSRSPASSSCRPPSKHEGRPGSFVAMSIAILIALLKLSAGGAFSMRLWRIGVGASVSDCAAPPKRP